MNTSRKIQIALGTIFLWSSTAVSGLAATITDSGKLQSDAVQLPVESIPSQQLNLKPDTTLIAQFSPSSDRDIEDLLILEIDPLYRQAFEDALNKPNGQEIMYQFCREQPYAPLRSGGPTRADCLIQLQTWARYKRLTSEASQNCDLMNKLTDILSGIDEIMLEGWR